MSFTQEEIKHKESIMALDEQYVHEFFKNSNDENEIGLYDHTAFIESCEPHVVFKQRKGLETNSNYRQILPYTVFRVLTPEGTKFITYRRAKGLGESRLLGNYSVGFGGHIEISDIVGIYKDPKTQTHYKSSEISETDYDFLEMTGVLDVESTISYSNVREIEEEIGFVGSDNTDYTEVICDQTVTTNPTLYIADNDQKVGIFHIALINIVDVPFEQCEKVVSKEEDSGIEMVGLMSPKDILETGASENWTRLFLEYILK